MADNRIQYTEKMVGAGHPSLADTLNRLALVEHNNDGTHKYVYLYASEKGAASGLAELDASALIPLARVPAVLTGKDADTVDGFHAASFAKSGANLDISSLSGLTTPLSRAQGGTGFAQAVSPLFAVQNVEQSVTGTAVETTLASFVIPANTLGPNGVLRISLLGESDGVLSNTKTWRIRFGGTTFASMSSTTTSVLNTIARIFNCNSESAQKGNKYLHVSTGIAGTLEVNPTGNINTAVDQTLIVTAQTTTEAAKSAAITRAGNVATATVAAHGYANGDSVLMASANQAEYNGTFVISNVTTNTFDYTVSGSPATPATGTITSARWTKMDLDQCMVEVLR